MNNCGLTSLKNFPHLERTVRLELMENSFPGSDLAHLKHLTVIFENLRGEFALGRTRIVPQR